MSAIPPSSPSRRHFIGIAAAAARKLSMISIGSSALSVLGTRDAAAGFPEHERHHYWDFNSRRHREYGDVGNQHGSGGPGYGSGSGGGQARGSGPRSGYGSGSGGGGGSGSGSAGGSGSGGRGSGSGSAGTSPGTSGSGSGSGSSGGGSGSGSSGSGSGSGGYGTAGGYGTGSGGYGPGSSGSGSGSGGVRCFAPGTRILTTSGEITVENLAAGIEVVTANGPKPVKWVGRQTLKRARSAAWYPRVLPVCVSQFAIDDCTPSCDVFLSQDHCLFIDGALIPARHLVNGHSIRFDESALDAETLEYFHVELDTHEVIYASGLPVESFMYSGGAVAWDDYGEYRQRYGEHRIMSALAPVHSYEGGFDELRGLVRLAASRFIDVRDPIQIAHDRLKERAQLRAA